MRKPPEREGYANREQVRIEVEKVEGSCSMNLVDRAIQNGELPSYRRQGGQYVYVKLEDLAAFIERRTALVPVTPKPKAPKQPRPMVSLEELQQSAEAE